MIRHRLARLSKVAAIIAVIALLFMLKPDGESLIPIIAALVHECGHIAAIRLCGTRVDSLKVGVVGAEIALTSLPDKRKLALILASGSGANLVSGALAALLVHTEFARLFAICSLALAAVNLLPIESLDGGELLRLYVGSTRTLRMISGVTVVMLWLAAVVLLLFFGNMSLYVLSVYLFVTLYLRADKKTPEP